LSQGSSNNNEKRSSGTESSKSQKKRTCCQLDFLFTNLKEISELIVSRKDVLLVVAETGSGKSTIFK
jgi:ABC-type oligopeptide transport system ATPase subunit